MTGVEHYLAAERLGRDAERLANPADTALALAAAQVHATLAVAAAAAAQAIAGGQLRPRDEADWRRALNTRPAAGCDETCTVDCGRCKGGRL